MKLKLVFLFAVILLTKVTISQNSTIKGKVIDEKTGETLPGAIVVIEGTTIGSNTDFDGLFSIGNLTPGKYILNCKLISYNTKILTDVIVKSGEPTIVTITLGSASTELGVVEVVATMNKETTSAMLVLQKNNASVSDGISSESIKRTPDRSTSDVLKRVSGASIQDNKFAIIRGMSDRYNAAFINGAPLPSSESDRKAFAFDIFPANILDNIVIIKTATPDITGDFSGGVIQINTKSITEKNAQSISLSTNYNSLTTFKDFKTYSGGKYDWLGIDDGTRKLASGLPNSNDFNTKTNLEKIDLAKQVNYSWDLENKKAAPGVNLQYTLANIGKIFKKDAGSIFAITYNNNFNTSYTTRREFGEQSGTTEKVKEFNDTTFSNTILGSAMWNLTYKLNDNNQISVKNLFSINSEDKVVTRKGLENQANNSWEKSNVRWFTQNTIYSGQLSGDHLLPKSKIKFKWVAGYSDIKRDIPSLRKMIYRKNTLDENDDIPYTAVLFENTIYPYSAGSMFFAKTTEKMYSIKYDASIPFQIKKSKHEFKMGGFQQSRDRNFVARLIGYTYYKKGNQILPNADLSILPEDQIFSPSNIGILDKPGKYDGGFKLSEATTNVDSYKASSFLNASYAMFDSKFFDRLRFIYGVRIESYSQSLIIYDLANKEVKKDTTTVDFLPSINAVYALTEKINIRAAYYRTVSRPEFRELAPFNFYDFVSDFQLAGNPDLKRATIDNYDLRFEWFPSSGQLFSVSGFYKELHNAIEQVAGTGSQRNITFVNVNKVTNVGAELEYRILLNTIFQKDSSSFFKNTTLFSNFTYVKSVVDVSKINGAEERPLQGQSPYIINAGIQYLEIEKGWGISISYNLVGRRIVIVGNTDEPTYWENPRNVIDIQLVKTLLNKKLEIKFNAKDILAQRQIYYQDLNHNKKLDKGSMNSNKELAHTFDTDNIMMNTKIASSYTLSLTYKF